MVGGQAAGVQHGFDRFGIRKDAGGGPLLLFGDGYNLVHGLGALAGREGGGFIESAADLGSALTVFGARQGQQVGIGVLDLGQGLRSEHRLPDALVVKLVGGGAGGAPWAGLGDLDIIGSEET